MGKSSRRTRLCAGVSLSALVLMLGTTGFARAEASDAEIKALRAQVEQLTQTVNKLMAVQAESSADAKAAKKQASQAEASAAQAKANAAQAKANAAEAQAKSTTMPVKSVWDVDDCSGHRFLEHKPGKDLTFYTHCGEMTVYGQLDVSLDGATKNAKSGPVIPDPTFAASQNGDTPVGNFGWMPDISTNISYLGVRGFQRLPMHDFNFVYQFEAGDRHFSDARHQTIQQQPEQLRSTAGCLAETAISVSHPRNTAPSKSARPMRPTRTRRLRSIRSSARGAITRSSWATPAATTASSSARGSAIRSGTSRRNSVASSSMCCSHRARIAPPTAAIFLRVNPIAPAATIRPAAQIRS